MTFKGNAINKPLFEIQYKVNINKIQLKVCLDLPHFKKYK